VREIDSRSLGVEEEGGGETGRTMRRARGRNAPCVATRNTLRTRAGKQTQSNQFARLIDFPSHAEREREREREGGRERAQRVVQIQSETPV